MDYYDYGFEYGYEMGDEIGAVFGIAYIVYMLIVAGLGLAQYILRSAGMHTIARRRGINNPWLAWIPVANFWILGSISDQFRYVTKGQIKSKRKILLVLKIVTTVVSVVLWFIMMGGMISVAFDEGSYSMDESIAMAGFAAMLSGVLVYTLVVGGLTIATTIIRFMALYDLYTSVSPNNNVMFLVLSIIFNITEPFFIFCNRKSDAGMPPRNDAPAAPVDPVYREPVCQEPVYLPPQEPWENSEQ